MWFCFGRRQGWGSANVTAASCVVLLLPAGNFQKHPLLILPEHALFFQPLISGFCLFVFWNNIKAVLPGLPHSLFCVIIYKFLLKVVDTIMSKQILCQSFLPGSGPVLLDLGTGRQEHCFNKHFDSLLGGCSSAGFPSEYLL